MARRSSLYLLTGVVVFTLLAGCAPAAPAAPSAPTPRTAPQIPVAPAASETAKAPAPKQQVTVRMIAGDSKATTFIWCTAMSLLLRKHSSWLRAEPIPSKGLPEALILMLEGKSEFATANNIDIQPVLKGQGMFQPLGPRQDVRLVTTLAGFPNHVIVPGKSPIKAFTYEELKGKKIVTREIGAATTQMCHAYLDAMGIDRKKDVKMLYMSLSDAVSAMMDETAQVAFMGHGVPNPAWVEAFMLKPFRLVPIPKELTDKVNAQTGMLLADDQIRAGLYKGVSETVPTSSSYGVFVTKESLGEDISYELMKIWWEYADERNEVHASMATDGTVDMLKRLSPATGLKFHKGALKYYQERGWIK